MSPVNPPAGPPRLSQFDFSPRAIADAKLEIVRQLAPFDAIQVLGAIAAFASVARAEVYSEPDAAPSTRLEYVASVLLERDCPAGLRVLTIGQTQRQSAAIQRALNQADAIGLQTTFHIMSRAERSGEAIERMGAHLQLIDAGIRGPGYEHQAKEMLRAACAAPEVEAALMDLVGFTSDSALALEAVVTAILEGRIRTTLATIDQIVSDPEEKAYQLQRRGEYILSVTASEVAKASGLPVSVIEPFLNTFSVRFGESRGLHVLSGLSDIRARPLVAAGDGRFLWTSGVNLLWSLQPMLEETLKPTPAWARYQADRAARVEQMTVHAVGDAIRADSIFANLRFEIDGAERYEVDGLVIVDDVAFVLEAKSGRLNRNARRGRKRQLRGALEQLIGRASNQALRLAAAIETKRRIDFYDADGAVVDVGLTQVARVEPIIVTLEDLAWLNGHHDDLVELQLLDQATPAPWIVSCYDLETICKTLEFPGQLTLYLQMRRAVRGIRGGSDELNLWMIHLLRKLEFPPDVDVALVSGDWTDELDRYFMFGFGALPKMPLARSARREIERLDRQRLSGHVARTETIIASDQAARPLQGRPLSVAT